MHLCCALNLWTDFGDEMMLQFGFVLLEAFVFKCLFRAVQNRIPLVMPHKV